MPSTYLNNNLQAFFALLKAGLWEREVRLLPFKDVDFRVIYRLSEEQSVDGLITAGANLSTDIKVPQPVALHFIGNTMQIEHQNKAMNEFVGSLFAKLKDAGIEAQLVKGQGIAQCYERPLWRACGDVDILLNKDNYFKAKRLLQPVAQHISEENQRNLHLAMTIDTWEVELHGTLRSHLWKNVEDVIDEAQKTI